MTIQEIIDRAIDVLEKDAAIMKKITELDFVIFTKSQEEILLGMSKLSTETVELLKSIKKDE